MATSDPCQSRGHYLIAAPAGGTFYVRVVGIASMSNSTILQEVLESLRRRGFSQFVFDLSSCTGFDSTFMGILLGVVQGRKEKGAPPVRDVSVTLVNGNEDHKKLLKEVGLDRVVHLRQEPVEFPPVELRKLDDRPIDPQHRIRVILTAHENLVRLGGPNIEKFGATLDLLKRELGLGEDAVINS